MSTPTGSRRPRSSRQTTSTPKLRDRVPPGGASTCCGRSSSPLRPAQAAYYKLTTNAAQRGSTSEKLSSDTAKITVPVGVRSTTPTGAARADMIWDELLGRTVIVEPASSHHRISTPPGARGGPRRVRGGERVYTLPALAEARDHARHELGTLHPAMPPPAARVVIRQAWSGQLHRRRESLIKAALEAEATGPWPLNAQWALTTACGGRCSRDTRRGVGHRHQVHPSRRDLPRSLIAAALVMSWLVPAADGRAGSASRVRCRRWAPSSGSVTIRARRANLTTWWSTTSAAAGCGSAAPGRARACASAMAARPLDRRQPGRSRPAASRPSAPVTTSRTASRTRAATNTA